MRLPTSPKRVLALDVHPRSFGYVVFEGSDRLLDWGVRSYRSPKENPLPRVQKNLQVLFRDFAPGVLVVKEPRARIGSKLNRIMGSIRKQAARNHVSLRLLSKKAARRAFSDLESLTKHGVATALAKRYPELAWKLPPKRKPWQSEDYRMSIFDAAALGVAYLQRQISAPSELN